MKTKLHFGLIVLLLVFLGRYLEQTTIPNQQIVIQFSDKDVAKEDAQNTIEIVKKQLLKIGIEYVKIVSNGDRQLKITYYSDSDVEQIQNLLSEDESLKLAYNSGKEQTTNFPESKSVNDYELNISEIQDSNNGINWDFEGTKVSEYNPKYDQSYNPKINSSGEHVVTKQSNNIIKVAVQANKAIVITIDNLSYKIPEVRAGPIV